MKQMNWQKLYKILAKELPRHRGSYSAMRDIVIEYGNKFGIKLNENQIKTLIGKFSNG